MFLGPQASYLGVKNELQFYNLGGGYKLKATYTVCFIEFQYVDDCGFLDENCLANRNRGVVSAGAAGAWAQVEIG